MRAARTESNDGVSPVTMSRHVTSRHVTSRHVTSRHVTSRHVTSRHVITDTCIIVFGDNENETLL